MPRSRAAIAAFSARDAAAYDAWEDFWDRVGDLVEPTLMRPPITLGELAERFERAGARREFQDLMQRSISDLLGTFFESERKPQLLADLRRFRVGI